MESMPAGECASCGGPLSETEVAFGARLCPACSSRRAEEARNRAPEDRTGDVEALEQEILERVQRELAVNRTVGPTTGSMLFDAPGARLDAETDAAGLVLIDGLGVLVPLPSDAPAASEDPPLGEPEDADRLDESTDAG